MTVAASPTRRGRRHKILALSTYGGARPAAGGPLRLNNLYSRLAARHDVTLVTLTGAPAGVVEVCPGYHEINVAKSHAFLAAEARLSAEAGGAPVADIAYALCRSHASDFDAVVADLSGSADCVVLEHPYLLGALAGLRAARSRLVLDCHNVETVLKSAIYPDTVAGRKLLSCVQSLEQEAVDAARALWCCSDEDANLFAARFGAPRDKLWIVPNGVDCRSVPFTGMEERRAKRSRIGLGSEPIAYFIGSWHGPNIEAATFLCGLARSLGGVRFVLAGTVCDALAHDGVAMPANLVAAGAVSRNDNLDLLGFAQVALNPMRSGSGTHLKMFEYAASGTPILTTPLGLRGTGMRASEHLAVADLAGFANGIGALLATPSDVLEARVRRARALVQSYFDWDGIAGDLLARYQTVFG